MVGIGTKKKKHLVIWNHQLDSRDQAGAVGWRLVGSVGTGKTGEEKSKEKTEVVQQ